MDQLLKNFLADAISDLQKLEQELLISKDIWSDQFLQNIFRRLHTIKGTSATFDLTIPSSFAHEIENLLQNLTDRKNLEDKRIIDVLKESVIVLKQLFENVLQQSEVIFPQAVAAKIRYLLETENEEVEINFPADFPADLANQLSTSESRTLNSAFLKNNQVFVFEVEFDQADFDKTFKELRHQLSELGRVITVFPTVNFLEATKMGFRILFETKEKDLEAKLLVETINGKTIFQTTKEEIHQSEGKNLSQVIEQAISGGKKTAQQLGKEVRFEVFGRDIEISEKQLSVISKVLTHLVRNAVDHGIETPNERISNLKTSQGIVTIAFSSSEKEFCLAIKDDGRGIDTKKVLEAATAKNLISLNEPINSEQVWQLVFKSGLSTANKVSGISGRGIGLDAVEEVVNQAKGKIHIHSEVSHGAIFEVRLPNE